MKAGKIINAILDLAYPPGLYCICCGKITDASRTYGLCDDCMDSIKWIHGRTCDICGKQLSDRDPLDTCFSCREHPHSFRKGWSCTEYGMSERSLIFAMKYHGRSDIAEIAGEIMFDRMSAGSGKEELHAMYDMIIPVPVHRSRRLRRGYNHAALMARSFAERAGISCDDDLIIRVRETRAMRGLAPDERRENIRCAFGIRDRRRKDVPGRRFLIIDDIYTTGATVDEIATLLGEAGASFTDVLTLAAGADMVKA